MNLWPEISSSRYHKPLTILAIVVIAIGLFNIVGWLAGWNFIINDRFDSLAMKFNTAFCFTCIGLSLFFYLSTDKRNFLAHSFTGIAFVIALISFLESVFGFTTLLDELFVKDAASPIDNSYAPGRMSLLTSACFMLICISNFFLHLRGAIISFLTQLGLHLITLASGIAFMGYLYNAPALFMLFGYTPMAIETTILFFILSTGLSLLRPKIGVTAVFTSDHLGSKIAARLFPVVIVLTIAMGFLRLFIQKNNSISIEFAIALNTLVFLLVSLLTIAITAHYINSVDKKRKQAEASLELINQNLQNIVKEKTEDLENITNRLSIATASSGIGIWDWDLKKDVISWNENMSRLYGFDADKFEGVRESWTSSIHPDDKGRILNDVQEAFKGTKQLNTEFRVIWQDGSIHYLRAFSNVQRDENGVATRMVGTNWDITAEKKQLERIRENEEQYHNMIAGVQGYAIYLLDINGNIKTWNKGAEIIKGYKQAEIIGKNFSLFYTKTDIENNLPGKLLDIAKANGKAMHEGWRTRKDGTLIWCSVLISALYDTEGNVTGFTKVTRDLTEEKRKEATIKNNEQKFQLMLSALGDNAWEHDFITGKTDFSENIYHLIGYKASELSDNVSLWWSIVHPQDLHLLQSSNELYKTGLQDHHNMEYRIVDKNGIVKWVLDRGVAIEKDNEGKPLRIIGTHSDITERKLLQSINKEQEETIRLFVKHTPAAVAMFDKNMNYIVASDRWLFDYGLQDQNIIGKCHYDIFPEIRSMHEWISIHERCLLGAVDKREEDPFPRVDGKLDWLQWEIRPWRKQDDTIGGIIMFTEVITAKVLAREHLKQLNQQLVASNKDLEQFAYVASHDLQEPLRMVTSFLQLFEKKYGHTFDETGKEYINFAVDGAQRMKMLINDLLEFSKVSVSQKEITPINISLLLNEIIKIFDEEINQTGAEIIFNDMPVIKGNRTEISQLFLNLLGNALKYRNSLRPKIEIQFIENGHYWQFSIADNGIGINQKYFDKIFEIFQRLHTKKEYSGTGIGLSICKKIAESHGGKIWVESEEGKGTCFYFTIAKNL